MCFFPAFRMKRLKGCLDGSTSTAWNYAGLMFNLYRDAGLKHCHHYQTSLAHSPFNPFHTWCNMLLGCTIPPLSAIPSSSPQIPPHSPFTSPLFFSPSRARELGAIIIITRHISDNIFKDHHQIISRLIWQYFQRFSPNIHKKHLSIFKRNILRYFQDTSYIISKHILQDVQKSYYQII